jgi:hypothetical protein
MKKENGVLEAKVNLIVILLPGNILKEGGILMLQVAGAVIHWKRQLNISNRP